MLSRVIAALHRWAETGWAGGATALWELMQSSVVPGPSGAVFAPLAVSDPPRAPRLALWGLAGAIVGGCVAYFIGARVFDEVGLPVLSMLHITPARLAKSEAMFDRHGVLIVFVSTISPLSTKLTSIAAGAFGLPFATFIPALVLGRAIRFAALTILLRYAGERWLPRLLKRS